ncbi:ABC-type Fe2+-enterobactin transport system substrate-binding protein [Nocardiopsis arvandica]|uniref:ABC-type Fe2+-enterobactin transport system substrate-binding protein n=1 Tax=Nocardiopsis sinuspersici TaxID=501010 RepID=A0A7Z0BK85_9ACTN|nr:hypothetical protein [Nocardiopsis sinuspersici]NYH52202.1 ABC-type Fe2+-enterobactin transport system substrate-binding protein [Nocardiopsis sinuspersici]
MEITGQHAEAFGRKERAAEIAEEATQGRLVTHLGLILHELPGGLTTPARQEERGDIVELPPERASDFGDSILPFVNTQGQEVEDYLETSPILESLPVWEEDRVFTLDATLFRMDHHSVPLVAERLVKVLGS